MILCHGKLTDDGDGGDFNFMQAGKLDAFGQIGLLTLVSKKMMAEGE